MFLKDPSVLLALNALTLPLLGTNYPSINITASIQYVTHLPIVSSILLWLLIEIYFPTKKEISLRSHWYLTNGIFFHSLLDAGCGWFQIGDLLSHMYIKMDPRYGMPFEHEGMVVTLTSFLEIGVMGPLCLCIYYGYWKYWDPVNRGGLLWVYCLEIIVAVVQNTGTFYFYGQELIHVLRGDGKETTDVDYGLEFTMDYVLYFWGAFICAAIPWFIVPFYMIKRAHDDIQAMLDAPIDRQVKSKKHD